MESFTFELNCLPISKESRLSDITFKELELISKQDYLMLRNALEETEAIWYALENRIYLVGDERELRNQLANNKIETGAVRLVEYSEMLNRKELALRAILHTALARLMAQNEFRPSISSRRQSYYPYFDIRDDIQVTSRISGEGFTTLIKDGLQFAFDLSPEGRALLWVDVKLFTFVHFEKNEMEPGKSVYIFCANSECPTPGCEVLVEGAFLEELDDEETFSEIPCASSIIEPTLIRSKAGNRKVLVPYQWVYTTVNTRMLREMGIFDRWREIAIRPAPCRYQVMQDLIGLITDRAESLVVPFPEKQDLVFSLSLIRFTRKIRWPS
jgi:hypothetical protein